MSTKITIYSISFSIMNIIIIFIIIILITFYFYNIPHYIHVYD